MFTMESRFLAVEKQIHQLHEQQTNLKLLLAKFTEAVPSLSAEAISLLGQGFTQNEHASILTPPATPPPVEEGNCWAPPCSTAPVQDLDRLASDILDIIHRYGQNLPSNDGNNDGTVTWLGKSLFMERVKTQITENKAIRMILPAFPWKSVNKVDKVTGSLPDLGEELALHRLNQMCEDIKEVYPLGGQVVIATDGLLFDDVVGITDEETWAYGEGLIEMARQHGLENIRLLRAMEILGMNQGEKLDKALYMSLVEKCRQEVLTSYGRTEEEVRQMMKDDPDTLSTYCGFIRFLEADLKYSPITAATKAISGSQYRKTVKKVAIQMMIRAESFTKLLQAHCTDYVRLSIHPSSGSVKLSVPLIVQSSGDFPRSPWHSSLALGVDGSYSTVFAKDVRESHELVLKDGRGYYFREKSDLWHLSQDDAEVAIEPRYPNRLIVRPAQAEMRGVQALSAGQIEKLKALKAMHTAGPIEVVDFANNDLDK